MTKTVNKIPEVLRGLVIKTKYLGATNSNQARIKATHLRDNGVTYSKTTNKNFDLEPAENALVAAQNLVDSWPTLSGYDILESDELRVLAEYKAEKFKNFMRPLFGETPSTEISIKIGE